eukprot:957272-Amorphochlora_amoeboformis.AAC.1
MKTAYDFEIFGENKEDGEITHKNSDNNSTIYNHPTTGIHATGGPKTSSDDLSAHIGYVFGCEYRCIYSQIRAVYSEYYTDGLFDCSG